ncbi:MAG: hypothetical protein SF051_08430 [Elusimicrobiota bacterium]|nr:hypothetical protein [Elusimicrobiota bacterium]
MKKDKPKPRPQPEAAGRDKTPRYVTPRLVKHGLLSDFTDETEDLSE